MSKVKQMHISSEWSNLISHPSTTFGGRYRICAAVSVSPAFEINVAYELEDGSNEVMWPRPSIMGFHDELWRTTCFELFLVLPESQSYIEFNFLPSTQWSAYKFESYRGEKTPIHDVEFSKFSASGHEARRRFNAEFSVPNGTLGNEQAGYRAGLAAVIEERCSNLSYWALTHPTARPDFHHEQGFTKNIAPRKETT